MLFDTLAKSVIDQQRGLSESNTAMTRSFEKLIDPAIESQLRTHAACADAFEEEDRMNSQKCPHK
ncbi:hypothetical protein TO66_11075 [Pseudomonas sp. MRSN 12121]|nr:hypothetical protein TO66_11075 [Pseudomonas sp. MRSN 12121]